MSSTGVNYGISVECGSKGDILQRRLVSTPATCRGQCHPSCSQTKRPPPVVSDGHARHCGRNSPLTNQSSSLATALLNGLADRTVSSRQQSKRPERTTGIRACKGVLRLVFVSLTTYLSIILFVQVLAASFYIKQAVALPIGSICESKKYTELLQTSQAAGQLLTTTCLLRPRYEQFMNKGTEPPLNELERLFKWLDGYAQEGIELISENSQCVDETFKRLAKLRPQGENDELIQIIHDFFAIELHQKCISLTLTKMPKVPTFIEEMVSIYVSGPENQVIDLNLVPDVFDEGIDFDVDAAIAKYGKLEDVAPVSLTMSQHLSDNAVIFRKQCKDFVDSIELIWEPMELMSKHLATDGNAIKHLNNFVLNNLKATKNAKICTQLSTWQ